jgi:hypothetical protein
MENWRFIAIPVLFPFGWWLVTTILRRQSGMDKQFELPAVAPLRTSRWGSATVNGIPGNNVFKIDEFDDGYLLRAMWLFGNGKLWLPKPLNIGPLQPGRFLAPKRRVVVAGLDQVILVESLADFIQPDESAGTQT